jgi:hypothetical protein
VPHLPQNRLLSRFPKRQLLQRMHLLNNRMFSLLYMAFPILQAGSREANSDPKHQLAVRSDAREDQCRP